MQGVADPDFDEIDHAARRQVSLRARDLRRLELGGDQAAAAIVAQRGRKMQRRDAERGAVLLDDRARAAAARQHVEERARFARHQQWTSFRRL